MSVTGTSVIQQRGIDLPPGATTGFGPGEYNPTPYEGEGGRGWCIFEQGTAMTVLAHLTAAERQAGEEGKALPERFRRAQASRAKVYDIGGEAPVARECSLPPKKVLDEACRAIEKEGALHGRGGPGHGAADAGGDVAMGSANTVPAAAPPKTAADKLVPLSH